VALAFQIEEEGRVQIVRIYIAGVSSDLVSENFLVSKIVREREIGRLLSYYSITETNQNNIFHFIIRRENDEHLLQHLAREEGP
jgi:hypothetical protein